MTPEADAAARLTGVLARDAPDVLRYLERRVGADDAADALAEVMLAAWRRASSLPGDGEEARMWLFGIARNVLANLERSRRRRSNLAERLRSALASAPLQSPASDEGLDVRDVIARLPAEQAELVRLIHWEGFTVTGAAAIIGIPASTARTRYQRALSFARSSCRSR